MAKMSFPRPLALRQETSAPLQLPKEANTGATPRLTPLGKLSRSVLPPGGSKVGSKTRSPDPFDKGKLARRRKPAASSTANASRPFHGGAGLLLAALPRPSPPDVLAGTIRYLVFDDTLCGGAKLLAVIALVEGYRARWRASKRAPRCYALVRVTEVSPSLRTRLATAGIALLGRLTSEGLDAKARELEALLPGPSEPAPLVPWPRPRGQPRPLTEAEQAIANEVVAASRLTRDRDVD